MTTRRSLLRCRSGQFIVITALIIGMVAMASAVFLYETQVYEQHFRYRPYQDVVMDLENDVKRALACSLANATITYNKTWSPSGTWNPAGFDEGESNAEKFMQQWQLTAINAFAGLGANLMASNSCKKLVNMTWARPDSISSANSTLKVNMTGLGMFSWQRNITVALRITVNMSSFAGDASVTNLTFRAICDYQMIVNDLSNTSVRLAFYDIGQAKYTNVSLLYFDYRGNGVYIVEVNKSCVKGLKMMMWVQDRRGILTVTGFTIP